MMIKNIRRKVIKLNSLIEELEERLNEDSKPAETYKINFKRLENLYDYKEKITYKKPHRTISNYEIDDNFIRSREKKGEKEYHTSYGWFTDKQIKNLQNSKYFNE